MKIAIVAIVFASIACQVDALAGELRFELRCDKEIFLVQEPVWIDMILINNGADTVEAAVPSPATASVQFVVIQNGTDTLSYMGDAASYAYGLPSCDLPPGDTLYGLFNLLRGFEYSKSMTPLTPRPLQGAITVKAIYMNEVSSNTLALSIVEPTGEEATAYRLLREGLEEPFERESMKKLDSLLENYSRSVYAPLAAWELSGAWGVHYHDSTNCARYTDLILSDYPWSGYVLSAVARYVGDTRGDRREARLSSLMTEDLPFRLRMIARNALLNRMFH
jgi:hypothetical protein